MIILSVFMIVMTDADNDDSGNNIKSDASDKDNDYSNNYSSDNIYNADNLYYRRRPRRRYMLLSSLL